MREIKFRAFIPKLGHEKEYPNVGSMYYWELNFQSAGASEGIKNNTVMQFTGLHDKKGKEIYEGDIVKGTWSDYSEKERPDLWTTMVIKFGEGEVDASDYEEYSIDIIGFYAEYLSGCDTRPSSILFYKKLEIIGNIHENKDLLTK